MSKGKVKMEKHLEKKVWLIIILLILNSLDLVSTKYGLENGGYEINPLSRYFIQFNYGYLFLLVFSTVYLYFLIYGATLIGKKLKYKKSKQRILFWICLSVISITKILAALNNFDAINIL